MVGLDDLRSSPALMILHILGLFQGFISFSSNLSCFELCDGLQPPDMESSVCVVFQCPGKRGRMQNQPVRPGRAPHLPITSSPDPNQGGNPKNKSNPSPTPSIPKPPDQAPFPFSGRTSSKSTCGSTRGSGRTCASTATPSLCTTMT